jgi:hypothetical protein
MLFSLLHRDIQFCDYRLRYETLNRSKPLRLGQIGRDNHVKAVEWNLTTAIHSLMMTFIHNRWKCSIENEVLSGDMAQSFEILITSLTGTSEKVTRLGTKRIRRCHKQKVHHGTGDLPRIR